jgi:hypothetical protein
MWFHGTSTSIDNRETESDSVSRKEALSVAELTGHH